MMADDTPMETIELRLTADQSHTAVDPQTGQTYHSAEGAVMESMHVYVDPAFAAMPDGSSIRLLEVGFGTGLNALLTLRKAMQSHCHVHYTTLEPNPLPASIYNRLNHPEQIGLPRRWLTLLHSCRPDMPLSLPHFTFTKKQLRIQDYRPDEIFDVVYFDAFSPDVQPEMWTAELFRRLYDALRPDGGILLTYSAKGSVKKALREALFRVVRLPGAGSKHHMLKAVRDQ